MSEVAAPAPSGAEAPASASGTNVDAKAPVSTPIPKTSEEKFLVKVNGTMRELTRAEVITRAQKADAAAENFQKAAKVNGTNKALLQALQDPQRRFDALKELGLDPDQLAEERLARRAQEAALTPEQKLQRELDQLKGERESERKAAEDSQKTAKEKAAQDQAWQQIEASYMPAVDAALASGEFGKATSAEILFHMADAAEANLEYGIDLTPEQLVSEAKGKLTEAKESLEQKMRSGLQGDSLLKYLGEGVVNEVLKAAVAKHKGGQAVLTKPTQIIPSEAKQEKTKWLRPNDIKTPFF